MMTLGGYFSIKGAVMNALSGDISPMVFRQVVRNRSKNVSLDSRLLQVFLELDGSKALDAVARETGLHMADMRDVVAKLLDIDLIEVVEDDESFVDSEFFRLLNAQFLLAVGPIAEVLIEDETEAMGYTAGRFPIMQAVRLVERLALDIQRKEKKETFILNMVNIIKAKGY